MTSSCQRCLPPPCLPPSGKLSTEFGQKVTTRAPSPARLPSQPLPSSYVYHRIRGICDALGDPGEFAASCRQIMVMRPSSRRSYLAAGVLAPILQGLEAWPENADAQLAGLFLIAQLANGGKRGGPSSSGGEAKKRGSDDGGGAGATDDDTAAADDDNRVCLVDDPAALRCVAAALSFPQPVVAETALCALSYFVLPPYDERRQPGFLPALLAERPQKMLLSAAKAFRTLGPKSSKAALAGCVIFSAAARAAAASSSSAVALSDSVLVPGEVPAAIVGAMRAHAGSAEMQRRACGALRRCAEASAGAKRAVLASTTPAASLLEEALLRSRDPRLHADCCGLLAELCRAEGPGALSGAELRRAREMVLKPSSSAASAAEAAGGKKEAAAAPAGLVPAVCAALRLHPGDARVQAAGCRALANACTGSLGARCTVARQGGCPLAAVALAEHQGTSAEVRAAAGALASQMMGCVPAIVGCLQCLALPPVD